MKIGTIIFARMSSTRLPGKTLIDISGSPLISRVIERANLISLSSNVIVATSTDPSDDRLVEYLECERISFYRGSLYNLVERALGCCQTFGLDAFVRVCGDRPFIAPDIIDAAIQQFQLIKADLVSSVPEKSLPPGLTTEIVSHQALSTIANSNLNSKEAEHLTTRFYARNSSHNVQNLQLSSEINDKEVRLVVDTKQDLDRARWITQQLDNPALATISQIIQLAQVWISDKKTSYE